jgi:thiosulfate/3-mercaptopyruvate sulfurtransferase
LIDAVDLHDRLDDPRTVVLDCRFTLSDPDAGRRAYVAGHIPRARYADLNRDLSREAASHEGRHPLPAPDVFAATLGRLGVERSSDVVLYDDAGGAIAARAWWMLRWLGHPRVAVLDGGLAAWKAAGYALEAGDSSPTTVAYAPWDADPSMWVTTEDLAHLRAAGHVVLDARAPARYRGEAEPIDPVAGHVPDALNLPFDRSLDADGRFRDPDALRRLFAERLKGRPAVAMCGSGVTACHLLLAMEIAEIPGGTLYVGSWSEWIRDAERPIALGES